VVPDRLIRLGRDHLQLSEAEHGLLPSSGWMPSS